MNAISKKARLSTQALLLGMAALTGISAHAMEDFVNLAGISLASTNKQTEAQDDNKFHRIMETFHACEQYKNWPGYKQWIDESAKQYGPLHGPACKTISETVPSNLQDALKNPGNVNPAQWESHRTAIGKVYDNKEAKQATCAKYLAFTEAVWSDPSRAPYGLGTTLKEMEHEVGTWGCADLLKPKSSTASDSNNNNAK
jgi:hypothetical protein